MAEESPIKMMPTDEVIDAKIEAALEEPLRTLQEHGETLAKKADGNTVYDKTTVDAKVKTVADAVAGHVADTTHHITAQERETWNNKPDISEIYTRQQSDQIFAHIYHEHTNDGWFVSAINAVKKLIPALPSWLTPTREEPPTKEEVASKADKVANATAGNLATLDENGNLVDSGNRVAGAFAADSFIGGGSGMVGFELDSTDKWVELYIGLHGGVILKFPLHGDTLAVQEDIAPTFDETDTYDEGALVFHNGLYRCVNPNGHTGAWVAADFAVATVEDVLTALRTALAGKADASSLAPVATSGNYGDLRGRPGNVSAFANDAGYLTAHQSWSDVKPSGGITASDLAAAVQTSLGKADTALQAHQDISGKVDKEAGKGLSTNDYTNEDKAKLGTAYTPDNPPPAPDLSGYATKDAVLPRYYFTILEVVDGVVTVPPYTSAFMPGNETAFTIAVGEGNSMYLRDCILCVQCGDIAPTITWPANFHPRTDAETDFACVAGAMNVYWISEYAQGEFAVAGWRATAGGSAV